jgi:XTP/dITP diphosphohydrolase
MKKNEIVFATHNMHKAKEVQLLLGNSFSVLTLNDIGCHTPIEETGTTLEQNAWIKCQYVHNHYGYDCFADDTGLEVEALHNAPGVYSARYAGEAKNDEANIQKLLTNLHGVTQRGAQFKTVIACIVQKHKLEFEGILSGYISNESVGTNGFGYDPIFIPTGYTHTLAQLSMDEKNTISHRAKAIKKLVNKLITLGER